MLKCGTIASAALRGVVVVTAGTVFASFAGGYINAASAQKIEAIASPEYSWAGAYVGGHAGVAATEFDSVFDTSEIMLGPRDLKDNVLGRDFDLNGGLGGLQFGYNIVNGRYVSGVEADWTYLGISDRRFDPDFEPEGTDNASVDINWLASLRARHGIIFAQSLLFATAGVAWVNADYTAQNGDENNVNAGSSNLNSWGFVVGGGIETALSTRFSVRMEGLYYGFNNRVDTSALNTDSDPGDYADLQSIMIARIALNYKLSNMYAPAPMAYASSEPYVWRGYYAGVHLGYGVANFDSVYDTSEIFTPINTEDSVIGTFFDLDGFSGGAQIGFNKQIGHTVFGLEADWTYLNASDTAFDPDGSSPGGDDSASVDLNWLASLRGRLGYATGRSLLYGTAGVAWVNSDYTAVNGNIGSQNQGTTDVNATGFVFGGGIEHAIKDNVLLRAEVLQYKFNDNKDTSTLSSDSDPGDFAGVDDVTIARIGITFKFDSFR